MGMGGYGLVFPIFGEFLFPGERGPRVPQPISPGFPKKRGIKIKVQKNWVLASKNKIIIIHFEVAILSVAILTPSHF